VDMFENTLGRRRGRPRQLFEDCVEIDLEVPRRGMRNKSDIQRGEGWLTKTAEPDQRAGRTRTRTETKRNETKRNEKKKHGSSAQEISLVSQTQG